MHECINIVFVTGAKAGWNLAWQTMMNELAPHTKDGSYARPTYTFSTAIGTPEFPVSMSRQARLHLCP